MEQFDDQSNFRRFDTPYTDEMLFDPLPMPFRFVNKILVQTIEAAIDLAEDGGSAEALNAFVSHNLRLTKVGKIPTLSMENYILSTAISPNEISCYKLFSNTRNLLVGNNQGAISIFDFDQKQVVFTYTASSKYASGNISQMISFPTDHNNHVVGVICEDCLIILIISGNFALKGQMEVDVSSFSQESISVGHCLQPFIYVTDGTGKTIVYDCHTPSDLVSSDPPSGSSTTSQGKGVSTKSMNLEIIFETEKCLVSNGPVNSEQNITVKIEDPVTKKKGQRKKQVTSKGGKRAKSPASIAAESAQPTEITHYNATVAAYNDLIMIYFEGFNILLIYETRPQITLVSDFSLPSKVTCINELRDGVVGIGFENGSFCLMNLRKQAISNHLFQKKGAIIKIGCLNNTLFTFTENKNTTAYKFDGKKIGDQLFSLSDEDVIELRLCCNYMMTWNGKPSNPGIVHALCKKVEWAERELDLLPSISCVFGDSGRYMGTINTPSNLQLITVLWNQDTCVFVYKDPKDYLVPAAKVNPTHGKRSTNQKGGKNATKKGTKSGKLGSSRKVQAEEPKEEAEPMIVQKREIIGMLKLDEFVAKFEHAADSSERASAERRSLLKTLSQRSVSKYEDEKEPKEEEHSN